MLTDTKLKALKVQDASYRMADSNGLCIEVRPTGSKVWRYRYRINDKASMVTIGEYPAVSLQQARTERDKLRAMVKAGTNPAHAQRAAKAANVERNANTFGAIGLEYLAKREREGMTAHSVERDRRALETYLAPIYDSPISDVTAPMLLAALRKLEQRGVIETTHRARALAGRVFKYAVATGRGERNPAADLTGALERLQVRHFPSVTKPEQIGALLRALHSYQGSVVTQAALKLAPLVFVRPGELRHAKWEDIDLDAAEWRYMVTKTKTQHIVPLSTQAVAILRELHPYTKRSAYVFPSERTASRPMSENTINAALRGMGYDRDTMTGHGFRAMARTLLDEVLGFRPDYIEHQLAHNVKDPLGRAYNRTTHLQERRKMMQAWSDYLDGLRTAPEKVVAIRKPKTQKHA
ncbi:integrase arm-type DNA-binding domain-containing protein [Pseudoxanthomonas mexicana]|uniref:tyrosine-type recombinase/integrase n=1 Tax=Pseudoxanthomonas mexicana TaxID=128785 RepID=UPI0028AE6BFB|nr:integrase arm-type DNA-binding domain-containing protein [Pseudoxanthomonas mexicana]